MPRLPRIPDLLTTANLSCGVASILLASQGQLTLACWLVFAGAAFDVLDGLAARALGGGSPLGVQLDSLADMVTFGVAPAFLLWSIPADWLGMTGCVIGSSQVDQWSTLPNKAMDIGIAGLAITGCCCALIPICSAWRLAKFNVDTRQSIGFLGLPTPANGLFWASLVLILLGNAIGNGPLADEMRLAFNRLVRVTLFLPLVFWLPVILGGLMLSELPLPSLKFKHMKWKGNEVIYLLLAIGLVLVLLYGILAVPLILLLYLLSPLWGKLFPRDASPQRHGEHREE